MEYNTEIGMTEVISQSPLWRRSRTPGKMRPDDGRWGICV